MLPGIIRLANEIRVDRKLRYLFTAPIALRNNTLWTSKIRVPSGKEIVNFVPAMIIQVMKSKIHRVRVTEADLNYIGSITIDENLMDAANLIENEQVHVLNYRNGERIITYVIKGQRGSGVICLNGPAALKFSPGDDCIVISYCDMEFEAAKKFNPSVIFPDVNKNNQLNK